MLEVIKENFGSPFSLGMYHRFKISLIINKPDKDVGSSF